VEVVFQSCENIYFLVLSNSPTSMHHIHLNPWAAEARIEEKIDWSFKKKNSWDLSKEGDGQEEKIRMRAR
jgi:hypothetical protein